MDVRMAVYGAAAAAIARVPHVMTMHGNQKMTAVWRRRAALRLAFRHGGTTAAVSLATKRQLDEDLGLDQRLIQLVHNGVPLRQGDPSAMRLEFSLRPDALLEAMVAGRAVIASDTSGIPEAVTTEREGLLVPPGDEESLSRALEHVLTNDVLRTALGRAADERGRREFSVGAMTDGYEALYRGA